MCLHLHLVSSMQRVQAATPAALPCPLLPLTFLRYCLTISLCVAEVMGTSKNRLGSWKSPLMYLVCGEGGSM
jgi:hypothetical protein